MTKLKDPDPLVSVPLQHEYNRLLSDLPDSAYEKLGAQQLNTVEGRAKAMTNLVAMHAGEVAELDPRRSSWLLRLKEPGFASADWQNEQWRCCENGEPVGSRADEYEYGKPDANFIDLHMINQINFTQVHWQGTSLDANGLKPDWLAQVNRCIVPC